MCLFLDAAKAWSELEKVNYVIDIAKKGVMTRLDLSFSSADFPHLAGMQYAAGIDFGISADEYYGAKLIPALMNGKMDARKIEASEKWDLISGRLSAITNLQNTLDENFCITAFNSKKVRGYSKIDAKFVIKSTVSDDVYFVFLDERSGKYYCRSAFRKETVDYTENQSQMTILRKIKTVDGISHQLFLKDGYSPN